MFVFQTRREAVAQQKADVKEEIGTAQYMRELMNRYCKTPKNADALVKNFFELNNQARAGKITFEQWSRKVDQEIDKAVPDSKYREIMHKLIFFPHVADNLIGVRPKELESFIEGAASSYGEKSLKNVIPKKR